MNYIVQDTSLAAVADAIRAKTGSGEALAFPAGFVEAVENISAGSAPDGSAVSFGYELRTEITQAPTGKAWFNGVLLPKIPEDVLAQYPYAWIRNNTTTGYYDLMLSGVPFYYLPSDGGVKEGNLAVGKPWYRVPIATAETATAWEDNTSNNTFSGWGIDSARTVIWSNHNIPNGSATATSIYFKGSEPVTEVETTTSIPVERLEKYAITSADLNTLGAAVQNVCDVGNLLTVSEMAAHIKGIQAGGGNSGGLAFSSAASGSIVDFDHGYASSTFTLAKFLVSNADGELQEG